MCCVCNLAINNEETLPFVTLWVNLEDIMLSEVSLTERQIHTSCSQLSRIQEKQKNPHQIQRKRDEICGCCQRQAVGRRDSRGKVVKGTNFHHKINKN